MTHCNLPHRYDDLFATLPHDQGGDGRHRCAACSYDRGYADGLELREDLAMNLVALPKSQAGVVRHKSPHAAYALGYFHGVTEHYQRLGQ